MKNLKSLISMLLCVVLLLGVMGAGALAAAEDPAEIIDAAVNENQLTAEAVTEEAAANVAESAESEEVQAAPETGKKESKLKSVFRSELYIKANEDAKLDNNIKVNLDLVGGTGTLYLPGKVDFNQLSYSWDNPDVVLMMGKTEFRSGEAPIAAPGEKVTYKVKNGLAFAYLTVKTMQGSPDVEPMYLNIDESLGTIKAMNGDDDHETSCYGNVLFGDKNKSMSIKGRGNSTWSMPKKPYNMTIYKDDTYNKKDSVKFIQNGVKSKKWTLLANYFDNALIRNKIAFDLAKAMKIGLDSQFVDLWMNGEYLGNYLLCQKKDFQKPDDGFILENDHIPDPLEVQFPFPGMHNMPLKHNLLNIDMGDNVEESGTTPEEIEAWFTERWNTVLDYDSEEYQKYFDLESWAKMFLMFEVSKTYDCYAGNIIMSVDNMAEGSKLVAGPAWDYDIAFGRTLHKFLVGVSEPIQVNAEGWYNDSIGYLVSGDKPVTMLQEFGKHASFMREVVRVYNQYKKDFEDLAEDVDAQAAVIEKSALMDRDLMGLINLSAEYVVAPNTMKLLGSGKYKLNYRITTGFDDYIYNLKEYCTKRVMWLSDHLAPGVDIVTYHGGRVETGTQVTEDAAAVSDSDTEDVIVSEQDQSGSDSSQLVVEEAQPEPAVEKAGLVKTIATKIKALFSK